MTTAQITASIPSAFQASSWRMKRLISIPWMIRISYSRKYYALVILMFILFFIWSGYSNADSNGGKNELFNWAASSLFLGWCFFCVTIELTRVDRTILRELLWRFEWWYLVGNSVLLTVLDFATSGRSLSYEIVSGLYVIIIAYAVTMDAMVQIHPRLKVAMLIGITLNNIHVSLPDSLSNNKVNSFEMCILSCADARQMLHGSGSIITAFLLKQLYLTVRYPNRTALLTQAYYLTVGTADPTRSAANSIATLTPSNNTIEMISKESTIVLPPMSDLTPSMTSEILPSDAVTSDTVSMEV